MEKTQALSCWKAPPTFPTLPQLRRRVKFVSTNVQILGADHSHLGSELGEEVIDLKAYAKRYSQVGICLSLCLQEEMEAVYEEDGKWQRGTRHGVRSATDSGGVMHFSNRLANQWSTDLGIFEERQIAS